MILHALILQASLAFFGGEHLVLIKNDHSQPNTPHQIALHDTPGTTGGALGPPLATDLKFQKSSGNNPTLFLFAADVDGDGADEIIHVRRRTKKGEDLQLRAYAPPSKLSGDTGKPVASSKKKTLGNALGEGRVILMAAGDHNDDGVADAYVIREYDDGHQELEIRRLPHKSNQSMKKLYASDTSFGHFAGDRNIRMFAADPDDDTVDEILVVRLNADGKEQLLAFEPPKTIDGETGPPIFSIDDLAAEDGASIVSMGGLDPVGVGKDQLAIIRLVAAGVHRLEVFPFPNQVGSALPSIDSVDVTPLESVPFLNPIAAFGIEGFVYIPPPPPTNLAGQYSATFSHLADDVAESIPGLGLLTANYGGTQFQILLPTFHPLLGIYSIADGTLDFSSNLAIIDQVGTGVSWFLNLTAVPVTTVDGKVLIEGSYSGVKQLPFGQQATITAGTFKLQQQ